ncbi:TadE-like protein [Paenibacillus sp. UNCCL117]|uniref:pilus assembly protein n=1 Tax=unclassified Paenibacillus TaxID=185978 RepID=UPI0008820BC1|nr:MULTISPECIES: pilus assembly protein [unclassified Paenibacillus]SDC48309.1 TadE-like protein [Paenibacillus sp. cl123]SFW11965.1 TadE-like protein [Paenibacillus sp. UNCCL117]
MRLFKSNAGGMVLEAALVLPLFVSLLMLFASMIRLAQADMALQAVVSESAKVIAANLYPAQQLYGEARQRLAASPPGVWLEQAVAQADAARSRVIAAETFTEEYGRFIPEPIVRLMAWERDYRAAAEAAAGEQTDEWKRTLRRKAAEASTPLIASFGDASVLRPGKFKVTDVRLPDFHNGTTAAVIVEAQYEFTLLLPFVTRKIVLRKQAREQAWIGG